MEDFVILAQQSRKEFTTADHLTYMTYPLVKDPKLIISIIETLNVALTNAMNALLLYDQQYKRVQQKLPDGFEARFHIFRSVSAPFHNIEKEVVKQIPHLRELLRTHKESIVEFVRKQKVIICNDGYTRLKTITIEEVKEYIQVCKPLFAYMEKISHAH